MLLLGASADESSTDGDADGMGEADEWGMVCSDPPSPCNVVFEGSNVIINGRSNLRKLQSPRQQRKVSGDPRPPAPPARGPPACAPWRGGAQPARAETL